MSDTPRRRWRWLWALLVGLLVTGWSYVELAGAAARATSNLRELKGCQRLAARISGLRERPEVAERRELEASELTARIEEAAARAGIGTEQLLRIEPGPARRLGESAYREKPTRVELGRLKLEALVRFLHDLVAQGSSLMVTDLRIEAPHGDEEGEDWTAEATLSYLVYDPKVAKE